MWDEKDPKEKKSKPVETPEENPTPSEIDAGGSKSCSHPKDQLERVHDLVEIRRDRDLGRKFKCKACGQSVNWTSKGVSEEKKEVK